MNAYNPRDHYFKKAKEQNFAARSVFKLEEIDAKFHVVKSGMRVLDLGASPGSWSQYCAKKIGPKGVILGIDLKPVTVKLDNATFIQADLRDLQLDEVILSHGFDPVFDLVISDMAPNTTGIRLTDQARSFELCELALQVADRFLRAKGDFVCKFFHSDDFTKLRDLMKTKYEKVEIVKPDSTRKISKEIFLIGLRKKTGPSFLLEKKGAEELNRPKEPHEGHESKGLNQSPGEKPSDKEKASDPMNTSHEMNISNAISSSNAMNKGQE